jgi:hypothetical protein
MGYLWRLACKRYVLSALNKDVRLDVWNIMVNLEGSTYD